MMTVTKLQCYLKDLGFDPGPIDGIHGPLTSDAVRKFQSEHGLKTWGNDYLDNTEKLLEHYHGIYTGQIKENKNPLAKFNFIARVCEA